jgi:GDP-L-fucose synthase
MIDSFNNKKILVTGGAGLLGVSLTKHFLSLGAEVSSTYFNRLPPNKYKKFYGQYDFNDFNDCLKATNNKDYVIISAVQASGVTGVLDSPTASILSNLKIHAGLFEACAVNKVKKVIWISSSSVYQEYNHPISESVLDLNSQPYDLYLGIGWVYRYLEQLANCYFIKRNLKIGIIRTANIYGPFDRFDDYKSHVIPALIKRAFNKENPFIVWGDKNTTRDFVYADDLSLAITNLLNGNCNAQPINYSSGVGVTIESLVNTILVQANHEVSAIFDSNKPSAVPYRVLNNDLYNSIFGKEKKTTLAKGIRQTIDWYNSGEFRE